MALSDALDNVLDRVRGTLERLNERERRMLLAMGITFVLLVVVLPFILVLSHVGDMEQENADVVAVLKDIAKSKERLVAERAEREAVQRLYENKAPPLASFLEEKAQQRGIQGLDVVDQPALKMGAYSRRSVRVSLSRVELRPFIEALAEIKNSGFPVAIQALQLEGGRLGGSYSARITVNAYDWSQ